MTEPRGTSARRALVGAISLTILSLVVPAVVAAVDVGEPAPGFTLPSTAGGDISLSDFRGKKFVLLEFYGADFAPT
jgi:AhpC/TSA family